MINHIMKLKINGEEQSHNLPGHTSFSAVIDSVNRIAVEPGLAISKITLNGADITGTDWTRYMGLTAGEIDDLEIETIKATILALDTIESLREFITDLIRELNKMAELFRVGQVLSANEVYSQALDGIQIVAYTTQKILRNLEVDASEKWNSPRTVQERLSRLDEILAQMLTTQEDRDWVMLADLIEYELVPSLIDRQVLLRYCKEEMKH